MDNTSFPRRLAEERKARGYTQKQIAEALGRDCFRYIEKITA